MRKMLEIEDRPVEEKFLLFIYFVITTVFFFFIPRHVDDPMEAEEKQF